MNAFAGAKAEQLFILHHEYFPTADFTTASR